MPLPLLPRNISDPTGQDKRERGAINDFAKRLKRIGAGVTAILRKQDTTVITLNALDIEVKKYEFNVTEEGMNKIGDDIAALIDQILLEGGRSNLWFMNQYVQPAYQQGTGQAYVNLATQSAKYAVSRPTLESVLLSPAYRTRLGYVRAREFEDMVGFAGYNKANLSRVLMGGMADGRNPNDIAKDIAEQTNTSISRSRRIARTEVNTALRRARLDEADDASEELGIKTMMMHISALSTTTRPSHAKRHSKLYTTEQVREWMAISPNSINCKCTMVEVLVDDKGKPLTPAITAKAMAIYPGNFTPPKKKAP